MKQIFTIFSFLLCSLYFVQSFGQASPRFILYYKPYTDSSETNLYRDTVIKFDLNTQYENIKNADIEKDVEIAILNKDYRIVGISGNSYLFPGLENKKKKDRKNFIALNSKYESYIKKHGFKVIEGTSDSIVITTDNLTLQGVAYEYALKYNRLLLAKRNFNR